MIADGPIIETRNLSMEFGSHTVLREINLQVPRGQTVAIIGESGCGKTVLLKTLVALLHPTSGAVLFDGHELQSLDDKHLTELRVRFGFVFQNSALFDSLTIGQNVAFPLRQHRQESDEDVERMVLSRLAEVGLSESVVPKKPTELSGGMRKRVGLARALIMNPEVLLYDEPTTGLDPIMSDVINELILRTRSRYPVTSIVVTHDMKTATKVADRIVMLYPTTRLHPGEHQVLYDGSPDDIIKSKDRRVTQFVKGEAGERLVEMQEQQASVE